MRSRTGFIPRYWRERRAHYRLEATRCNDCGRVAYPPSNVCRFCGSRNVSRVDLVDEEARLITWTAIYAAPEGFERQRPLLIGILETLRSGARLLARLVDVRPEELRSGMIMEPVLRRIGEAGEHGLLYYGIAYRPSLRGQSQGA
ncbi:MAG: Zn-ribbon domain-containing OB-fold protein [Desulfurococcaceae archaeon]